MSNVAKELRNNLTAETLKDEDGDGSQRVSPGVLSSMYAMHDSGSRGDEHPNLGSRKEMHEGLDGLYRATHDDLSISTAVGEVHGDEVDSPSSAPSPEIDAEPSAESLPSHVASHEHAISPTLRTVGEQRCEGLAADAASGTNANLVSNGKFSEHLSENILAFGASRGHVDGVAPHDSSPKKLSPDLDCNTREESFKGNMYVTSYDISHNGVGDGHRPKSPTVYGFSGWHACQSSVEGPNSHVTGMYEGRSPDEALPANGIVGNNEGERTSHHSPFLDSSPTRHTVVGDKGGLTEFACRDTSANCDIRGNVFNYRTSENEARTFVHEKSFGYNEPIVEDLQVNIEHPAFRNQDPSFPAKKGSVLSGSSYYTSHSSYLKNVAHVLRFGTAIFSLIAFSVMISNSEKRVAAGSTFYVRFSDFQAYNYLAALNLLTFLYSSGQLVLHAQARTGRVLSSPVKWGASVYLCDQILAFLMISSSSSAATASELSRHGLHSIWPPACSTWKLSLFCSKADVAVAMSFVSCFFMFLCTFSSGYHLSNLLAE